MVHLDLSPLVLLLLPDEEVAMARFGKGEFETSFRAAARRRGIASLLLLLVTEAAGLEGRL